MKRITAKEIDDLRKLTGKSMIECRKILLEKSVELQTSEKESSAGPATCPTCKNPNNTKEEFCEWCGNKFQIA